MKIILILLGVAALAYYAVSTRYTYRVIEQIVVVRTDTWTQEVDFRNPRTGEWQPLIMPKQSAEKFLSEPAPMPKPTPTGPIFVKPTVLIRGNDTYIQYHDLDGNLITKPIPPGQPIPKQITLQK